MVTTLECKPHVLIHARTASKNMGPFSVLLILLTICSTHMTQLKSCTHRRAHSRDPGPEALYALKKPGKMDTWKVDSYYGETHPC